MEHLKTVEFSDLQTARFESVLPGEGYEGLTALVAQGREFLQDRVVWNINSTARGGGVAEMLPSLLGYARGAGIDARWSVIHGTPDFFRITKRIHNKLHGSEGDGGALGDAELDTYLHVLRPQAAELAELVSPRDIVILHDPQTAGMTDQLKEKGAAVVWRCHVGLDTPNDIAKGAWAFLRPLLVAADAYVFSRPAFVWDDLPDDKITIIPPSIDAFSAKNQEMSDEVVDAILDAAGIMGTSMPAGVEPTFERMDGTKGTVVSTAELGGAGKIPADSVTVTQVSRWDRLKDPLGVIGGFAEHIAPASDAHLVLAGPAVDDVADDPEGAEVLDEVRTAWDGLDPSIQERVHLVCLPMDDDQENAALVNALQRRSTVVVQKSLAEGFGLTVAEAMWKGRPVVASRIGGIQDQIDDGVNGLLLDDPKDLAEFGAAVCSLVNDPDLATEMGEAARTKVTNEFLGPRHLTQYFELFSSLSATEA